MIYEAFEQNWAPKRNKEKICFLSHDIVLTELPGK